jgi:predicted nucleic acid-binding protein
VLREVEEVPDSAAEAVEEARGSWLQVQPVRNRDLVEVLASDLDDGEAE